MPDTTTEAQPKPEAKAQTPGEDKSVGNLSGAQVAAQFLKKELAKAEATTAAQTAPKSPETEDMDDAQPAAEEPKGESAEAKTNTTEEAAAEKAEAEMEVAEAADDDLSKSTTLDPAAQEALNRRIGKEVKKRKVLEAQLNEVRAQLADLSAGRQAAETPPPTVSAGPVPLPQIEDVASLRALQQQAKEAIRFAEDTLDSESDGQPLPEGFTRRALKEVIRNAKTTLEDHIPARFQFLQARNQAQQAAFQQFPFLKDKTNADYLTAQAFRRTLPHLANDPKADITIGFLVRGFKAVQAEQEAAKAKEAAKSKPPASAKPAGDQTAVSSGAAATPRAPSGQAKQVLAKATSELKAKGNVSGSDAARFLMQRQLSRNSR